MVKIELALEEKIVFDVAPSKVQQPSDFTQVAQKNSQQ